MCDGTAALPAKEIAEISRREGISAREAMLRCLEAGIWPERFRRNMGIFSPAEMRRLLSMRVFIAGCGGLGGEVANLLARMGVGGMRLCDPDIFEESNLNRQLFSQESNLGQPKALVVGKALKDIASHMDIEALPIAAESENLPGMLAGMDLAIDCLDSIAAKKMLEDAATTAGIPCLHGAVSQEEGLAHMAMPGHPLMEGLYPADGGEADSFNVTANVVSGTAALMCSLFVKCLVKGRPEPSLLHLDCSVPELERFQLGADKD